MTADVNDTTDPPTRSSRSSPSPPTQRPPLTFPHSNTHSDSCKRGARHNYTYIRERERGPPLLFYLNPQLACHILSFKTLLQTQEKTAARHTRTENRIHNRPHPPPPLLHTPPRHLINRRVAEPYKVLALMTQSDDPLHSSARAITKPVFSHMLSLKAGDTNGASRSSCCFTLHVRLRRKCALAFTDADVSLLTEDQQ